MGSGNRVGFGDRVGMEVLPQDPFGGAGLLDFGDERKMAGAKNGGTEWARQGLGSGSRLEGLDTPFAFEGSHFVPFDGSNFIQNVHEWETRRIFSRTPRAKPLSMLSAAMAAPSLRVFALPAT